MFFVRLLLSLQSLVPLYSSFGGMRIKRETGVSPVQSRCCKLPKVVHSICCHCLDRREGEWMEQARRPARRVNAHIIFEESCGPVFIYHCFFMRLVRVVGLAVAWLAVGLLSVGAQEVDSRLLDSLMVSESAVRPAVGGSSPRQRLSGGDLVRLGVTNVGDALKHISGVTVKDYGGVGGLKTVGVRGLGAQHTAVFYDGVAVGDCQSGQVDLGRYSTENLTGIELLIGQGDDIYRSARMLASAGVVSLETSGALQGSEEGDFRGSLRCGSFDTYRGSAAYSRSLGNGWAVSAFGEYGTSAGDYGYSVNNGFLKVEGKRRNSAIDELRGELNASWQPSAQHLLRMKLYGYGNERGLPGAVIVDNPITSDRLEGYNLFAQLFYEYICTQELKMKFSLKWNNTYDRHREPLSGSVSINRYRQWEGDFSSVIMWSPAWANGLSLSFSEDAFCNSLRSTNSHVSMPSEPERLTLLSALSARYSSGAFCATASLLHTFASESAPAGNVAPDRRRLSPSVALSYYPFEGDDFCLRASYKNIFRLPTFNDLYYREIGNYRLNPEKTQQYNVGVAYSFSGGSVCEELTVSVDAYCGDVKDKIVAVPGIFVWKMSNVGSVETVGADANVESSFALGGDARLRLAASYSYMRAVDSTPGSVLNGNQVVYTPLHSGSADMSFATRLCDFGYSLVWSGKRYYLAQNIPSNEIDAYCDHSLWVARNIRLPKASLLVRAEAKNILDVNYEIIRYYPMPGRNYSLSLILTI